MAKQTTKKKATPRRSVWRALFGWFVIFAVLACAGFYMWQRGMFDKLVAAPESDAQNATVVELAQTDAMKPVCQVFEEIVAPTFYDEVNSGCSDRLLAISAYEDMAKNGCPENATMYADMAARARVLADSLCENNVNNLNSEERICQTVENRLLNNIDAGAYSYDDFLINANTYATLFKFGCNANRAQYAKAAVRELSVALALTPPEHMQQSEIVTIIEIYKRLNVPELGHIVLQRLKTRGYDMDFLLDMEKIIHE